MKIYISLSEDVTDDLKKLPLDNATLKGAHKGKQSSGKEFITALYNIPEGVLKLDAAVKFKNAVQSMYKTAKDFTVSSTGKMFVVSFSI